jgi:hypothetical protein
VIGRAPVDIEQRRAPRESAGREQMEMAVERSWGVATGAMRARSSR